MQTVNSLQANVNQKMRLVLDNNETVDFHLYYYARMQSWYFDFSYKNITCNGVKVVLTPNALRQFRKNIPFGLMFSSEGLVEPFQIDDFSSGRVVLNVLNAAEVEQIEREIYGNQI